MSEPSPTCTLTQQLLRSEDVLFQNLDGEAVLLDLASETYFGLNKVGTRVWELMESSPTLDAISTQLQSEFGVEPARVNADLLDLATRLIEAGLASVA